VTPQFTAKHRLLSDSPTSGRHDRRDLQISLPSPQHQGSVRYQIVVSASEQDASGQPLRLGVRYDLEFTRFKDKGGFPFKMTIHEAAGSSITRSPLGENVTATMPAQDVLPGAQIAYDSSEQRLVFILPLPSDMTAASYTASLYDDQLKLFGSTLAADVKT
jgi:hypothetical protein